MRAIRAAGRIPLLVGGTGLYFRALRDGLSPLPAADREVRDRLELVKDILPDEATSPQIFKFDPALIPILQLEVSGNKH